MKMLRRARRSRPSAIELTLLIFGIIAFMYFTGEILKPLALAVLLSFALMPIVRLLQRIGLPRIVAVISTGLIVLTLMGGIGYVVGQQLTALAERLPDFQENIENKLRGVIKPEHESTGERLSSMVNQVTAKLERPQNGSAGSPAPIQKVEVVQQPTFQDRLRSSAGPYVEYLGVGGFVVILVLFMLTGLENLRDRIIALFGRRHIGLTTKTMEEIAQRISRYLGSLALLNSSYGLIIGLGLWMIGLPYAALWGVLTGLMRFIPYVGPAISIGIPVVFSFAIFPRWIEPMEVIALFVIIEIVMEGLLEPVIYGKSTGVSPLGLLIAAMFWTWLWGIPGLLLSTPLTVCLTVLGKYVPSLGFFAVLLDEEVELPSDLRLTQRLMALDREGSGEVLEQEFKARSRVDVFDRVLIPTLARAQKEATRGNLDESEQAFVWDVVGESIAGGKDQLQFDLATVGQGDSHAEMSAEQEKTLSDACIIGIGIEDENDVLILQMVEQVLEPMGLKFEAITNTESPLELTERLTTLCPTMVIISHLPPNRLTSLRYVVKRLRASFPQLEIVVGRWSETPHASQAINRRILAAGATRVVESLAELRDRVAKIATIGESTSDQVAPLPA